MPVKKTLVFLGSMFFLIHPNILFNPIRYASSDDTSTISFFSSLKDPACLHKHNSSSYFCKKYKQKHIDTNFFYYILYIILVLFFVPKLEIHIYNDDF